VQLHVKAKPNSRVEKHAQLPDGRWLVAVNSPAVEGQANAAIISYLSKVLGIPKSSITLKNGMTSGYKTFEIEAEAADVLSRLISG
jgi:uncharacterized protein YggU (UPF0235/DUF167 family)